MRLRDVVHRLRTSESGGAVIWWLIGMAAVAQLMFVLVADGSRVMAGLNETSDVAQVAARAGARLVDPYTGLLDGTRAETAAQEEIAAADMAGTVVVNGTEISVTASTTITLPLLSIVGIDSHTVHSTRTARAATGSTGP